MYSSYYAVLALALMPLLAPACTLANDPTIHMVTYIMLRPPPRSGSSTAEAAGGASRKDAGTCCFQILQRTAPATSSSYLATGRSAGPRRPRRCGPQQAIPRPRCASLIAAIDDRLCVRLRRRAERRRQLGLCGDACGCARKRSRQDPASAEGSPTEPQGAGICVSMSRIRKHAPTISPSWRTGRISPPTTPTSSPRDTRAFVRADADYWRAL